MLNRKIFSERLTGLLDETHMSQLAFSRAIGLSSTIINDYCSQRKQPNADNLVMIADYFDVSLDYLAGRSNSPERLP